MFAHTKTKNMLSKTKVTTCIAIGLFSLLYACNQESETSSNDLNRDVTATRNKDGDKNYPHREAPWRSQWKGYFASYAVAKY